VYVYKPAEAVVMVGGVHVPVYGVGFVEGFGKAGGALLIHIGMI
jgi:hypothetical protein